MAPCFDCGQTWQGTPYQVKLCFHEGRLVWLCYLCRVNAIPPAGGA